MTMISASQKKVCNFFSGSSRFVEHGVWTLTNVAQDSIAGQMNALKTGGLAGAPPKRSKKKNSADSSEDESDTEGEAGSDTSETNTDTDTDGE